MEKKRTHKLKEEDIQYIGTSYYLDRSNNNVNELCKKYDISRTYLYKLVKQERTKKLVKESITESEPLFAKKIDDIIADTLNIIQERIKAGDTANTNLKDLAIMIGTLYDKSRLEKNLSTENKAIEINIKVEH